MQQLASFRQKAGLVRTLKSLPFLAAALGVFLRPAAAMAGVARGLDVCVHTIIPVSYTHLDVYKRQAFISGNFVQYGRTRSPCPYF